VGIAAPARAQRITFERSFDTSGPAALDVSTVAGKITVAAGPAGRMTVRGTATVRVGLGIPPNGLELARRVAANPPIQQSGNDLRLGVPSDDAERRAVLVAYEITVPRDTRVDATSNSGAIAIADIAGVVSVKTQSSAIALQGLGSDVQVNTGSGAVTATDIWGPMTVATVSSAITLHGLRSALNVRTASGAVNADVAPTSDVDVETGSSAMTLSGGARNLRLVSRSGRIHVAGEPTGTWSVNAGSGHVELTFARRTQASLDLSARSGTIAVPRAVNTTVATKQHLVGTMASGARPVVVISGSGGIAVRFAEE
jgi:hypothetical protein